MVMVILVIFICRKYTYTYWQGQEFYWRENSCGHMHCKCIFICTCTCICILKCICSCIWKCISMQHRGRIQSGRVSKWPILAQCMSIWEHSFTLWKHCVDVDLDGDAMIVIIIDIWKYVIKVHSSSSYLVIQVVSIDYISIPFHFTRFCQQITMRLFTENSGNLITCLSGSVNRNKQKALKT